MEDTWRKAKHFGLGVLEFSREKVEALVNDMVKKRGVVRAGHRRGCGRQ